VELFYRDFGDRAHSATPLILLHGLFGSAVNWQSIAQQFAKQQRVIVPDQRNHGRSPHMDNMSYDGMANDLAELLDRLAIGPVNLVGHSMGGKTAMALALEQPQRVAKLVVVDTAPVKYPSRFEILIDALVALDLNRIKQRRDADRELAAAIPEPGVRRFLLQNLERGANGALRWRVNLPALRAELDDIMDFPLDPDDSRFEGDTLFLHGGNSDYVTPAFAPRIRRFFPHARLQAIPGAGHWLYTEKPREFVCALQAELARV
jgi:esterase